MRLGFPAAAVLVAGLIAAPPAGATSGTSTPAPTITLAPTTTVAPTTTAAPPPAPIPFSSPAPVPPPPAPTSATTAPAAPPNTGVPKVPTAGPPTTAAPAGAPPTTAPAPTTQNSVLSGVNADLDQLAAIGQVTLARQALAQAQQTVVIARQAQSQAQLVVKQAQALVQKAQAAASTSSAQLADLALAAYTGAAFRPSPPNAGTAAAAQAQNNTTLLGAVAQNEQQQFEADRTLLHRRQQAVRAATTALARAQANVASAEQAATVAGQAVTSAVQAATVPGSALAAASTTSLGTADPIAQSPTILGPSILSAAELAAWFASTGHTADTTVPIGQLAADYLTAGQQTGVRGDIAFAQSIIETGYFSFPAGGQLTAAQNNFAGIGACDSCPAGWSFPDAQTGVTAQEQLLEAYASPQRVPTPLIGPVGVGGCCPTWMDLAGKWATDRSYGLSIMGIYKRMLDFVLPSRLAAAGLSPPGG